MHARNFTTNVPKILDLKSSPEQIFFRKLSLGAPELLLELCNVKLLWEKAPVSNHDHFWDYLTGFSFVFKLLLATTQSFSYT